MPDTCLDDIVTVDLDEPSAPDREMNTLGLIELLLKRPGRVDELNRQPFWQRELFPRFLLIGEVSYVTFGVIMVLLLNLAPPAAYPHSTWFSVPAATLTDGAGLGLIAGYAIGVVLAACVCLPSFYFYSLLAGVRMTWLQISTLVGKGTAANAVLLLGILPIYVAVVLGLIVVAAPAPLLEGFLTLGLLLPSVTGLWGLRAIYLGIMDLGGTLPEAWQCRRRCFLRRLTLSWAVVYSAVVPVMIYRLWEYFTELLRMS